MESHVDHQHEDAHVSDHTIHTDNHHESKSSSDASSTECPHYHLHCPSLCLGIVIPQELRLTTGLVAFNEDNFSFISLKQQDYQHSLLRPPIA